MGQKGETYFESIESAHEFIGLLMETVFETKRDIEADAHQLSPQFPRRLEALHIALYSLEKLELHLNKSRRILKDLRSLHRLLFEDGGAARLAAPAKSFRKAKAVPRVTPSLPAPLPPTPPGQKRWWQREGNGLAA